MFLIQHLYLLAALYFLFLWFIFFFLIKKEQKKILLTSIMGGIIGPLVQMMHLIDWWIPKFVFDSIIKIEDVVFGFAFGGVAAATYFILKGSFKQKYLPFNFTFKTIILFIAFFLLFGLFYLFHIHSFWASIVSTVFVTVTVGLFRSRLLILFILNGIILTIIVSPGYFLGIYLNPAWISQEWLIESLSGITFMTIPIEEYLWFILAGSCISAIQELWNNK